MSGFVNWIGAAADDGDSGGGAFGPAVPTGPQTDVPVNGADPWKALGGKLPAHNFPGRAEEPGAGSAPEQDWDRDPDLWLYRKKTTALLRRYMRWSLEAGRVPSLLGRELFRARISAHTAITFEARVIFLHDVERCLEQLPGFDREIIGRVVLQEYDHEAAARILQCERKTIERRLPELIDQLSEAFLKAELLVRLPETRTEDAL